MHKHKKLFDQLNPVSAYILGYIYADGCIAKNNVLIFSSIDIQLLEDIKAAFETTAPIKLRKCQGGFSTGNTYGRLNICSTYFCTQLKKLRVKEPDFFLEDSILTPHFIRGVFDGDGCISISKGSYKNATYMKPTCNIILHENVIQKYKSHIDILGIHTSIVPSKTSYMKYLKFSGVKNAKLFAEYIYGDKNQEQLKLDRKFNKFVSLGF